MLRSNTIWVKNMDPFVELINTPRFKNAPFSVPCPSCHSVATYVKENTKTYQTHETEVAMDVMDLDPDVMRGTAVGKCVCTRQECQEPVHFMGPFVVNKNDLDNPPTYEPVFTIEYFHPPIPLIRIPPKTPQKVADLLKRSFKLAFADQSAAGNLVRSAIEKLLTHLKVPRFTLSKKGRRIRLDLHARINLLPQSHQPYKNQLLAIKWIGNVATHDELDVKALKLLYEIIASVLENLYGTKQRELLREVKRVNRRRKP
jgi:hypothetical protein